MGFKVGSADDLLKRLSEAHVICECSSDAAFDVLHFCRKFLDEGVWEPPLPEDFSLLMMGSSWNEGREVISIRGVDDVVAWAVQKAVEDHPKYREWDCSTD